MIKYSPTSEYKDFMWRILSNQKFNFALKELAVKAKIDKPLFMHLARHTFATTITLSNGVLLELVDKMIGHGGMKNLMIYAKIVNSKVKKDRKQPQTSGFVQLGLYFETIIGSACLSFIFG